jgi:N-acetylmuramoyl-L-alanine amidase
LKGVGVRQLLRSRWTRVGLGLAIAAGCAVAVMAAVRHPGGGADVIAVRLGGGAAQTRIVVDLNGAASGCIDADAGPMQLAVDLAGASAADSLSGPGQGLVRDWKVANDGGGARLTLDLTQGATIQRRFLLPPADGQAGWRYVIDIAAQGPSAPSAPSAPPAARLRPAPPAPAVQMAAAAPPHADHLRKVIVIDPGHGGRDSGALGAGSQEKNVTLATALALRDRLERTGRYQVVMTRQSDVYVPLEDRVQIARRAGADLFLSLHADSAGADHATHGATVYTLSERGTQRVGYVLRGNEWFLQQASNDQAVGQILLDLTQRSTRNRSAAFAQTLIANVGDQAPLQAHSQRDANYFVLLAPDVPAALLEMGFITNPDDEARLNDSGARAQLVDKIAQAIDAYFSGAPRPRLAER